MRKRYFTVSNAMLALMIASLGFGACKNDSSSLAENLKNKINSLNEPEDVYGPPPEFDPEPIDDSEPEPEPEPQVKDRMPMFTGGTTAFRKYLKENMRYPMFAKQKGIEGTVKVEFFVEPDGSITDVTVKLPIDPEIDAEAVRLVKEMPRWQPAIKDGEAIRCKYEVPIDFKIYDL